MINPVIPGLETAILTPADTVYTPDWCAQDMVSWFKPTGKILEPCRGACAISRHLPPESEWCEISEGRDFFSWNEPVDWIISNPPFSIFRDWVEHSFQIADNIVYLVPLKNFFTAYGFMDMVRQYGWIKHIRTYGTGSKLNFPMGNAIGAMYFKKNYWDDTSWSFYNDQFHSNKCSM